MKLNKEDYELIEIASGVAKENADIRPMMEVVVACALKGKSGKIYKGINIKTSHSICAEQVAIGQGLASGEREFDTIVTVKLDGDGNCHVVSPCGLCRYTFDKLQFHKLNVLVEDSKNNAVLKVSADSLLPYPYSRD